MEGIMDHDQSDLNFKATELRLGLPGSDGCDRETVTAAGKGNKRSSVEDGGVSSASSGGPDESPPAPKAQIVGWPPVRTYRKNNIQAKKSESETGIYVKVSMDGAPYLRKIDLKVYNGYSPLFKALEEMFKLSIGKFSERPEWFKGSEYTPAYEDKDGDLMLVGDVPWDMFKSSCKRLRIMKGSEARGLM